MAPKLNEKAIQLLAEGARKPAYRNVLEDLSAFSGFTPREILERAVKKTEFGFGARGWFNEEFAYFNPRTPQEHDWFYRAGQIYLFSNARKAFWPGVLGLGKEDQPILDYGAGIGQNVLELYHRGVAGAWYFEIGALQTEFFRFRARRHGFEPKIVEPFHKGRFDPVGCLSALPLFRTILLLDVLEHVPDYPRILTGIAARLESGGKLVEHSPFASKKCPARGGKESRTRVHLVDSSGLAKVMAKLRLTLDKVTETEKPGSEVRTWRKI